MSKRTIDRLENLITIAKSIPDKLQDGENESLKFEKVAIVIKQTNAFIKAKFGNESLHLDELADINFRPRGIVYNSGHFRNDEVWLHGKKRLLNLLDLIKYEIIEPKEIENKGMDYGLFWTIIGIAIPLSLTIGYYLGNNQFNKDSIEYAQENVKLKEEINELRKLNADKVNTDTSKITGTDQSVNMDSVSNK